MIRTQLSQQEYQNLKRSATEKIEFLLTDLDRDPQTWVKNPKAIKEFEIIKTADKKGIVDIKNIRRPIEHWKEQAGDFLNSQTGETYEIKSITEFHGPLGKSFEESAENMANKIINSHSTQLNRPVADKYIIDASDVPNVMRQKCIDKITHQLEEANLLDFIDLTFLQD
jgi:hypothetical protein